MASLSLFYSCLSPVLQYILSIGLSFYSFKWLFHSRFQDLTLFCLKVKLMQDEIRLDKVFGHSVWVIAPVISLLLPFSLAYPLSE